MRDMAPSYDGPRELEPRDKAALAVEWEYRRASERKLVAVRVEQGGVAVEGEEQQVDHAEGGVVGAEAGPERGVANDREVATLDGAVEGLHDDPCPDAPEFAGVVLGFTQD